jgi:hypothetical protein
VRGFADRQLRVPSDPLDPSNRRISVIVHYLRQSPSPDDEDSTKAVPQGGEGSRHPGDSPSPAGMEAQTKAVSSPGSA